MKKILIDVRPNNIRVGVTEGGTLVEFWAEGVKTQRLVGNIYKGKVVNVLPGMQAAFVNLGLERNGFLYAGDTLVDDNKVYEISSKQQLTLKEGDTVLCQVLKDEFGTKGARITMNISIPGRLLVLMPFIDYIGISRKIENEERRDALTNFIESVRPEGFGYVVRTEAEFASEEEIRHEIELLTAKWLKLKEDYLRKECFSLLYSEEDMISRVSRDMLRYDVEKVIVNDEKSLLELKTTAAHMLEKKPDLFELYVGDENLFNFYGINEQIAKLLSRKVVLKNGGYIVIDRTEALTVIDVNTGKYVGDRNLEETVFITNKIAAEEIAKQLQLRNIGGIVIIDFIDMAVEEHREEVLGVLQEALKKDTVKTNLIGMTSLGLVELTRKKTRSMLEAIMLQPCPYCHADGYVWSDDYIIMRIRDSLIEKFRLSDASSVLLYVNPQIFSKVFALRYMEEEAATDWAEKRIYVIPDDKLHIEKYRIEEQRNIILELPDSAKLLY